MANKLVSNLLPVIRAATKLFVSNANVPTIYQAEEQQVKDLFFLVGAVAGANGQKNAQQVTTIQQIIALYLSDDQRGVADAAVENGKQVSSSREGIAKRTFGLYFTPKVRWLEPLQILDILLRVAMSDGNYTVIEEHIIDNVRRSLGVHRRVYWLLRDTLALRYEIPDCAAEFAEAQSPEFERYKKQMRSDTFGNQKLAPGLLSNEQDKESYYYKLLELSSGATLAQIKTQYRKLVRRYHPDAIVGVQSEQALDEATAKFCAVQEAYEYLALIVKDQ